MISRYAPTAALVAALLALPAAQAAEVAGVKIDDQVKVGANELVLNGANVNFIAFGSSLLRKHNLGLDGQLMALFVIVLAAAEAAVALAIALNFYNNHSTIDVDHADELRG